MDLEGCNNPQRYLNDEKIPHRKLDLFRLLHFQAAKSETLSIFQSFTSLHSDSTLTSGIFQPRAHKTTYSNASFTSAVWRKKQQAIAFWDTNTLYFCKHQWLVTGTFTSNGNTHILINHILLTAKTKAHSTPLHTNLLLKYPPISQQLTFFCLVALSGQITKLYFPFQLFHHNYPILI